MNMENHRCGMFDHLSLQYITSVRERARAQGVKSARERAFETRYFKWRHTHLTAFNGNVIRLIDE